ncbi:MAG TPA: hypothetical protein VHR17_00990, partial [Thermoanaerobaculia bacterium]|nr:hypothetical protein [Thermoanaerobaculia bacterium]
AVGEPPDFPILFLATGVYVHGEEGFTFGGSLIVEDSTLQGSSAAITVGSGRAASLAGNRLLSEQAPKVNLSLGGTAKCAGNYDGDFVFYPSTCP